MVLMTSAKGATMPAVRNESPDDEPVKLKVYEFPDGATLKMTATDAAAYQANLDRAASDRAAWEAGGAAPAAAPASVESAGGVLLTVLSKVELIELAEKRGLKTTGNKDQIAARFASGDDSGGDEDDEGATDDESGDDSGGDE